MALDKNYLLSVCAKLLAGVVFVSLGLAGPATAQTYPSKSIRVVNPWPPGGPGDTLIRPIMTKLSERLGQPVIIDNRPGASGTMGTVAVARAAPDGYTLLTGNLGPNVLIHAQDATVPYDSVKDFEPITQLVSSPLILLIRPGLPVENLQDLVTYAKARPGKLTYGNLGPFSSPHLAGEMLLTRAGINLLAVPYKGAAEVVTALISGTIDVAFINIGGAMPFVESGKLRAMAVTTSKRSTVLPNLPTVAEFYPGYEVNSWYGILAPARTPKDIIERLHREFVAVLQLPDIQQLLKTNGLDAEGTTPEQFGTKIKEDLPRWAAIVKTVIPAAK